MTPPFPSTPILDDFNRADTGPPPSANWTNDLRNSVSPGLAVRSNRCKALSVGPEASSWFSARSMTTDHEVYATIANANGDYELWARFQSVSGNAEGYLVWYNAAAPNVRIQKYGPGGVGGYHDVGLPVTLTVATGDKLGLRVQGSTLTVWHKPSAGSWTLITTQTDTTFTAGTGIGLLVAGTLVEFDDFGGGRVAVEQAAAGTVTPAGSLSIRRTNNAITPAGALAPSGALAPRSMTKAMAGTLTPGGGLSTSVTHIGGGAVMTMAGGVGLLGDLLVEQIIPPPIPEPEPVPPRRPYEPWQDCETVQFRNPLGDAVTFLMRSGATGRMMPPVKVTSLPVPVANGSRFVGSAHLERPVAVPVVFPGSITDRGELRRWARVLDPNKGEGTLTVVQGANAGRELTCVYEAGLDDLAEEQGDMNLGHLIFRAAWPYWADGIEQTLTATQDTTVALWFPFFPLVLSDSDAFAEFTVQIDGDVESWPVVDVTGPGNSVVATNVTTGKSWTVSGAIAAGSTLRVDTRPGRKQVLVDGANAFNRLVLPSSLWPLVQGANRIQLSMALTSPASRVDLTWRNSWLSA